MVDIHKIKQQILSYQHQVAVEERELTSEQEEEIRNIRSALESDVSEEAMDLDDRLVMIVDLDSRLKEQRHAL